MRHARAQLVEDAFNSGCFRAFEGKTSGAFVSSSTELLRDGSHIDRALAADGDAYALVGSFTKKHRYLDPRNSKRIVDQAFAIFVEGPTALNVAPVNAHPCKRIFMLKRVERHAQQAHFAERAGKVNVVCNLCRPGAVLHQASGEFKGMCVGGGITERAGISEHGSVKTRGNLRRDLHAGGKGQ